MVFRYPIELICSDVGVLRITQVAVNISCNTGNGYAGAVKGRHSEQARRLARAIATTRPDEIGCRACFDQLGRFVDLTLAGQGAAAALPLVQDHLDRCRDCGQESEALLLALGSAA